TVMALRGSYRCEMVMAVDRGRASAYESGGKPHALQILFATTSQLSLDLFCSYNSVHPANPVMSLKNRNRSALSIVFVTRNWCRLSLFRPFATLSGSIITFINGQDNTPEESKASAFHLSELGGGVKVHYVYNETHGQCMDLIRSFLSMRSNKMLCAGNKLKELWQGFLDMAPAGAEILHFSHSQGTSITKNTLRILKAGY